MSSEEIVYEGANILGLVSYKNGVYTSRGQTLTGTRVLATWADVVALDPSLNSGLVVYCTETKCLWRLDAVLNRPVLASRCFLLCKTLVAAQFALAAPKNTEQITCTVTIPRAVDWAGNGRSVWQNGDIIHLRNYTEYVYTGTTHATAASRNYRLGSAGTTADTLIGGGPTKDYTVDNNVGNVLDEALEYIRLSSTSVIKGGNPASFFRPGLISTSATLEAATTVTDIDSATMKLSHSFKLNTLGADDTLTQKYFWAELITPGV